MITAILAGDSQLYSQLIRAHQRNVHAISLSYTRNSEDAEDIAQETFLRGFRSLQTFRGDSKFSTWLIRIAINEAKNRLRREAHIRTVSLDEIQGEEGSFAPEFLRDPRELPSGVVEREQLRRLLQWAVPMLPNIYRQVFHLRDVEERSVHETARTLGISTSLVKVRLHRARKMLRATLELKLNAIEAAQKKRRLNQ